MWKGTTNSGREGRLKRETAGSQGHAGLPGKQDKEKGQQGHKAGKWESKTGPDSSDEG